MKIHRTKKGCMNSMMNLQQRPASAADKTSENQGQDSNHSAKDIHADDSDEEFVQALDAKRQKLNLPPASAKMDWEKLDEKIVHQLDTLIGKSTLEHKLATFGDIVYGTCRDIYGVKQPRPKPPPQKSRRQREMDNIRKEKRNLKKQMKAASEFEKQGLQEIFDVLKAKHSALSKAESARKKRSKNKKSKECFFRDPFQFARKLFEQPKSGTLTADKEVLEQHLRKTYSDSQAETPLEIEGLVRPPPPTKKFNDKPPTLDEVQKVVKKARAKSSPGPNGIPYLLYKKCPNVLMWLHQLIKSAWRNSRISDQWMTAEGVYIPKEQNSSDINQFRPISLLNVEGKIFFSVMASRLTKYLKENEYLDVSVQKGGIPGVPGCVEHATMIWDAIQRAKSEKRNLDVIWLDLANAYGSVPHKMIQLALEMHHVPKNIREMLKSYFDGFSMRFSTKEYTTSWVNLEVGIAMGCAISPILFVLAMEVILKAAMSSAGPAELGNGYQVPPLKAFMDDTTILTTKEEETHKILKKLDELVASSRMKFKPKKSRSLSLRKGKVAERVTFTVASQAIPTVTEEPVKSLGRWYDDSLKDTKRGKETKQMAENSLRIIDQCGLPGKYKVWCLQFMLIPKLLWPLLIYDISTSTVEAMEAKINKYTRKWLGVPPGLTDVALYCRQAKLKLPLKSLTEEYKVGKTRLLSMLEDSEDKVVRSAQPRLKTGRKWNVHEAVNAAKESLKIKEIVGYTQTNRQGLGSTKMEWWSKAKGKAKRDLVIQEIKTEEDAKRFQKAVQQSQQGQWTTWESALQRSLSWNDMWHMAPLRISFILRSVYDLLPSKANLVKWGKSDDPACPLCQGKQTVEHVLSSCKVALSQGRYTWRHNQVLKEIVYAITDHLSSATGYTTSSEAPATFYSAGGSKIWPNTTAAYKAQKQNLLDRADDWECSADLPEWKNYPETIRESGMRPDVVLYSQSSKQMILIELTVPYESRMDEANIYKTEKYASLAKSLMEAGFRARVLAIEIGARGFVGASAYTLMKELSISGKKRTRALKSMAEAAEKSSSWIWSRRNENKLHKA